MVHRMIFTSIVNDSSYFLRKLIIIHSFVETDNTEIYLHAPLSLGQTVSDHRGMHEIVMMISDLNSHRKRLQ